MSTRILDDEGDMQRVKNVQQLQPRKYLLSCLLRTEWEIPGNFGYFGDLEYGVKIRIAWAAMCGCDTGVHCGDCTKVACTCLLCLELGTISDAESAIAEWKVQSSFSQQTGEVNDDDLGPLISAILFTQPVKKYDMEEYHILGQVASQNWEDFQIFMNQVHDTEEDIVKRVEFYTKNASPEVKARLDECQPDLIQYMQRVQNVGYKRLIEWWKKDRSGPELPNLE